MVPSVWYFIKNTHLQPTVFFPLNIIHFEHELLLLRAVISSSIALLHFGFWSASSIFRGIGLEYREVLKATTIWNKLSTLPWLMGYRDRCASNSGSYILSGIPLVLLRSNSYLRDDSTIKTSLAISIKWSRMTSCSDCSLDASDRTGVVWGRECIIYSVATAMGLPTCFVESWSIIGFGLIAIGYTS